MVTARRKIAAAGAAGLLLLALLFAGCAKGGSPAGKAPGQDQAAKPADQPPISVSMFLMDDSASAKQFVTTRIIKDKFNIGINWSLYPYDAFNDKLNVMIASDSLPDLVAPVPVDVAKDIGPKGALLPLNRYFSKMPHLQKLLEQDPLAYVSSTASDGNIYALPAFDQREDFRYVPTVRTDLLAETGLGEPQTFDDLFQVLLAVKKLHPGALGIVNKEKTEALNDFGYNFNTRNGIFFDETQDKWVFGPLNAGYKEMIAYFHRLWTNGLLDPEFFTASERQWETKVLSGNAVFWLSWPEFAYKYERIYRTLHPGTGYATAPLPPITSHYYPKKVVQGQFRTNTWTTIAVSAKARNIDRLVQLLDWMYSDEGSTALEFGIPGETYEVVNGEKRLAASLKTGYNENGEIDPGTLGIGESGNLLLRVIRSDEFSAVPPDQQPTEDMLNVYRKNKNYLLNNNGMSLTFTEQELAEKNRYETDLDAYVAEAAIAFITGERPMSEYDKFTNELTARGAEELADIYNEAYGRFKLALQSLQ